MLRVLLIVAFVTSFLLCEGQFLNLDLSNNVCYCNYFDTPPVKYNACKRIMMTTAAIDRDGYLSFEGYSRSETNGLNNLSGSSKNIKVIGNFGF